MNLDDPLGLEPIKSAADAAPMPYFRDPFQPADHLQRLARMLRRAYAPLARKKPGDADKKYTLDEARQKLEDMGECCDCDDDDTDANGFKTSAARRPIKPRKAEVIGTRRKRVDAKPPLLFGARPKADVGSFLREAREVELTMKPSTMEARGRSSDTQDPAKRPRGRM